MVGRIALSLAVFALVVTAGCAGSSNKKSAAGAAGTTATGSADAALGGPDGGPAAAGRIAAPKGPAIVVTWEALSREIYLLENSRFRRRGPQPPQKITLISSSHPDAADLASGRTSRDSTASTAVLDDRDMVNFVKGLERSGFFRYARPAGYDTLLANTENARGRVTVTRGSDSRTLLSMRGQGLNEKTKRIPAIYSEAKRAIMVLRNMTPMLSVTHSGASGAIRVK